MSGHPFIEKLSEATKRRIRSDYQSGTTLADLASRLGCRADVVRQLCKDLLLPEPSRRSREHRGDLKRLVEKSRGGP